MNNFKIKQIIRNLLTCLFQIHAKFLNKRFYCNVLAGNSTYNLAINSDMTVSCNAQDYDGTGHIGNLRINNLSEIYNGPIAKKFRKKLAKGILPILTCSRCADLRWIHKKESDYFENHYVLPKGIMIENTVRCNLNCLSCARDIVLKTRQNKSLNTKDIEEIALMLNKNSILIVNYHNLGEPFLSPNIYDELKILLHYNPKLKIGLSTNGIFLNTDEKREAALMTDGIMFSIDGPNNIILTKYQHKGDFEKAYQNLSDLVKYRNNRGLRTPIIEWKYVLFNWNDKKEMILDAIQLAKNANVDLISFWPTKTPVYGISWRYYFKKYFKEIGIKNWKGRGNVCTTCVIKYE